MYKNPYFKKEEFDCRCGKCHAPEIPDKLIDVLVEIRRHFNSPVYITSGYRCKKHNKRVGGARKSFHKKGMAADIIVAGVADRDVQEWVLTRWPNKWGIGKYKMFTHIDVRKRKARWG